MSEELVEDCVQIDVGAAALIRSSFKLSPGQRLRVAYVAGPGDVAGTFDYWMKGQFDPRVPVIAYSTQLYTLLDKIGAEALILSELPNLPARQHPQFRFVWTPRRRGQGRVSYRIDSARFSRRVLKEIRNFNADIILIGTDAPLAILQRLPGRVRAVLTLHNTFWPMGQRPVSLRARVKQAWTAKALERVRAAVCTSQECRNQFVLLASRSDALFVEIPQVLTKYAGTGRNRDAIRRILYVGQIERDKGVFDLLSTFDSLAGTNPALSLWFAGSGSADGMLQEAIAQSRYSDRIVRLGHLSADQVHAKLEQADLLVCPTRSEFPEGLALVVIEAASHGLPTLLSSVVPAKDLLSGAVSEFPVDDVAALRAAMEHLVSSPDEYQELCRAVQERSDHFFDRSLSWGSQLYKAFLVAAKP